MKLTDEERARLDEDFARPENQEWFEAKAREIAEQIDQQIAAEYVEWEKLSQRQRAEIDARYKASLESGRLRRLGEHPQQLRSHPTVRDYEAYLQAEKDYRRAIRQARADLRNPSPSKRREAEQMLQTLLPNRKRGRVVPDEDGKPKLVTDLYTLGKGKGRREQSYYVDSHGSWRKISTKA